MKEVFRYAFVALLFAVLSVTALAQDRNMRYYDSHPSEILPDAQAAFKKGNTSAARDKARALQALNSDDPAARRILGAASSVSSSSSAASSSSGQGSSVSYSYVDLGLSVKWATCNLGATRPEEYGDYYAWGETSTKSDYSWSTYKFRTIGDSDENVKFFKYNTDNSHGRIDNKTVLEPEDDVAHLKLGGSWRIPTDAEWTELRERCEWTWTNTNGVNGYKFTGPNGNSIFLPAAGCRYGTSLGSSAGSNGYYWSSSICTDYPNNACYVLFFSYDVYRNYDYRFLGQSVRPVSE